MFTFKNPGGTTSHPFCSVCDCTCKYQEPKYKVYNECEPETCPHPLGDTDPDGEALLFLPLKYSYTQLEAVRSTNCACSYFRNVCQYWFPYLL